MCFFFRDTNSETAVSIAALAAALAIFLCEFRFEAGGLAHGVDVGVVGVEAVWAEVGCNDQMVLNSYVV